MLWAVFMIDVINRSPREQEYASTRLQKYFSLYLMLYFCSSVDVLPVQCCVYVLMIMKTGRKLVEN